MESFENTEKKDQDRFLLFLSPGWRLALALLIAILVVWGITVLMGYWDTSSTATGEHQAQVDQPDHSAEVSAKSEHAAARPTSAEQGSRASAGEGQDHSTAPYADKKAAEQYAAAIPEKTVQKPAGGHAAAASTGVTGAAFVSALIKPLQYELKERFYGWRPNDLVRFTDNVNNFQVGVLEVTRRATVKLAERISRTGSTDILDKNLEQAMNWFMVKADSYWFPAAENKYKDGLKELAAYRERLLKGEADFYTRTDNIIPLFKTFADLLGSCDENLVKAKEKDGKSVSTFAADNYFYYAKGVASAMETILEAVAVDFHDTLQTRGAVSTLHHAIHACHVAANLEPLVVTEGDLDGILANHRANMAAHISHARFYLDVLVNTLST